MGLIAQADLKRIISDTKDPEAMKLLVKNADEAGKQLYGLKLSTSQIRALFGEVRQIESLWESDAARACSRLILLKPKMAYRAKKESSKGVESLVDILDPAVDLVVEKVPEAEQKMRFARFVDLFEAILAYHRAHGGR